MSAPTVERWQVTTCLECLHPNVPLPEGFFPSGPWEPMTFAVEVLTFPQELVTQSRVLWKRPLFRIPALPLGGESIMRSTFTEFVVESTSKPDRPVPERWEVFSDWTQVPYDDTCWLRVLSWKGKWTPLI